ncbi:Hypothetical_protein [Hexamita inflata]|uniref:Hypothetical_protein n=1 Tax=Hexamita inflata TaxID=28002 RepID=A0ABP1JEA3_9EUKA
MSKLFSKLQQDNFELLQYLQINNRPSIILNAFTQINAELKECVKLQSLAQQQKFIQILSLFDVVQQNMQFVQSKDVQFRLQQHIDDFHAFVKQSDEVAYEMCDSIKSVDVSALESAPQFEQLTQTQQNMQQTSAIVTSELQTSLQNQILRVHGVLSQQLLKIQASQEKILQNQAEAAELPSIARSLILQNTKRLDDSVLDLGQKQFQLMRSNACQAQQIEQLNDLVSSCVQKLNTQELSNFQNEQQLLNLQQQISIQNSKTQKYESQLQKFGAEELSLKRTIDQLLQLKQSIEPKTSQLLKLISEVKTQTQQKHDLINNVNQAITQQNASNEINHQINLQNEQKLRILSQNYEQSNSETEEKINNLQQTINQMQETIQAQQKHIKNQEILTQSLEKLIKNEQQKEEENKLVVTKKNKYQWE